MPQKIWKAHFMSQKVKNQVIVIYMVLVEIHLFFIFTVQRQTGYIPSTIFRVQAFKYWEGVRHKLDTNGPLFFIITMVIPRSFILSVVLIVLPSRMKLGKSSWFLRKLMCMMWHFSGFGACHFGRHSNHQGLSEAESHLLLHSFCI